MAATRSFKRPLVAVAAIAILAVGAYYSRPPGSGGAERVPTQTSGQKSPASGTGASSPAGSSVPPTTEPVTVPVDPVAERAAIAQERKISATAEAQPPKTYIGPDGKPHEIVYNQSWILGLTPVEKEQYQAELLEQLKKNPEAFAQLYHLDPKFVDDVAAGRKPFPSAVMQ